ncbi:MAG: amidohydrolase family protein [Verrucomicrobiota bacterium]
MKRCPFCLLIGALLVSLSSARESSKQTEGLHADESRVHALVHATLIPSPGKVIEDATIVVRDGLIETVESGLEAPSDARIWDLSGKTVYAGFIDAYTHFGMPAGLKPFLRKPTEEGAPPAKKAPTPSSSGATYWNAQVTPQRLAIDYFAAKPKDAEKLNDIGFATVASFPGRGIFRGRGALVNLNGKSVQEAVVAKDIAQHLAFESADNDRGAGVTVYPGSLMGCVALTRQALHDGQWRRSTLEAYAANSDKLERPEENEALDALLPLLEAGQLSLFRARDETDYQRFDSVAKEFDLSYAIVGNGYEYRALPTLRELNATLILPLSFPSTPRVERADQSLDYSLEQLEHWELAPSNPAFIEKEEIDFCLTTHFLQNPGKEFWGAIRKAIQRGLSEGAALRAITETPATLYGQEDRLGTVEPGKIANLVVATGNLFTDEKAKVSEIWIDGDRIEKEPAKELLVEEGLWEFQWETRGGFKSGSVEKVEGKLVLKIEDASLPLSVKEREILFFGEPVLLGRKNEEGVVRFRAHAEEGRLIGSATLPDESILSWSASKEEPEKAETEEEASTDIGETEEEVPVLVFTKYPAGEYGITDVAQPESILVKNATLWTSGPDGKLEKTDILFTDGKVAQIGKKLKGPRKALVINANGKHVTPGLIDCHSHTAIIGGVNEWTRASSVEVRIGDVVNPVDINIYRQLAGGLTVAHQLHGSANPMGGQCQIIKLHWGEDAEGMKFDGGKPTVKFALGENVKQSNWGDDFTSRYPQTRMGVEQYMISQFRAAEDYEQRWQAFDYGETLMPPRKDLRSEATLEILKGDRSVHIHSYRQDEILTFARLAGKLGLDVGAFQHILEGYKVADALAEIGAGGSSFSDWWAYKFEVYDAIPYNGAIMHNAGVVTSFNSDNAELATRMNTEAAKAVKYGGLSEEEALKFVTLNAAIQLRAEDRIGSLEIGKDADFVIWNTHPLSSYAYAEQTWVDGIKRFDREDDAALRERDAAERQRLVQKALKQRLKELKLAAKQAKPKTDPPGEETATHFHASNWLYNTGQEHYSCSSNEEGGHQH